MDLIERREQLQNAANNLAIEESNLAEQIEALRGLERRAVEINRKKHQLVGAMQVLDEVIKSSEMKASE